jgi:hypothetical protein
VDLSNFSTLLPTASALFPLVTIHREVVDPDVVHIGVVKDIADGILTLREIDPNARWARKLGRHKISQITRVDFGGRYEDALARVGKVRAR